MEVTIDAEQGVELTVDADQGMEELEGHNKMQSSRNSLTMQIMAQPHMRRKEKLVLV
jgi:hypothetical protein